MSSSSDATGVSSLAAALVTAAAALGIGLLIHESFRCSSTELRECVCAPRVTRRLAKAASDCVPQVPAAKPLSWLRPVWGASDEQMASELDLDARVFVLFLRGALACIALAACFDLPVLLAVHKRGSLSLTGQNRDLDVLSIAHIAPGSPTLWAHVVSVLWKTGLFLVALWRFSRWLEEEQRRQIIARNASTVIVSDVPLASDDSAKEAACALLPAVVPLTVVESSAVYDVDESAKLLAKCETLVARLEAATLAFEKTGDSPTHRAKCCYGARVDSIETYSNELQAVDNRLGALRSAMLEGSQCVDARLRNAAFLTCASAQQAALAAQSRVAADVSTWTTAIAPPPEDLLWHNVGRLSFRARFVLSLLTQAALWAMVLFFMVPIAAVSAVSNLSSLDTMLPFLKLITRLPVVASILQGILPTLALKIFLALLPAIVRSLASAGGIWTRSGLDRAELRGLALFSFVNVFLGNALAGGVLSSLKQIADRPAGLLPLLGRSLPSTTRFFMSFILLATATDTLGAFPGLIDCLIYLAKMRLLKYARTPRLEASCWLPKAASLGNETSKALLIFVLTVCLSSIQPLVLVTGLAYFLLRLIGAKAQVLLTHEPAYSGDGRMWAPLRNRVVVALVVYQLSTAGVLGLKQATGPALVTLAVVPFTLVAMRALIQRFDHALTPLAWLPSDVALSAPVTAPVVAEEGAPVEHITTSVSYREAAYLPPDVVRFVPTTVQGEPVAGTKKEESV